MSARYDVSKITHLSELSRAIDLVVPGMEDWLTIDVSDEGHQAFLELVF
jgi:hypothetical protein